MAQHFITYGSCGHVIAQCRCPGPKHEQRIAAVCGACADAAKPIDTLQPCGHPTTAIVSSDKGTHYCGACEAAAQTMDAIQPVAPQDDPIASLEPAIIEEIRRVYSAKIWKPVAPEQEARDAVAAQCLRDMAPALARIAVEVLQREIDAIPYDIPRFQFSTPDRERDNAEALDELKRQSEEEERVRQDARRGRWLMCFANHMDLTMDGTGHWRIHVPIGMMPYRTRTIREAIDLAMAANPDWEQEA